MAPSSRPHQRPQREQTGVKRDRPESSSKPSHGPSGAVAKVQARASLNNDGGRHFASKVSKDLDHSAALFKSRLLSLSFGVELDVALGLIAPPMLQHTDAELRKYRSFEQRFHRGSPNAVLAYMKWYEWANFEAGKHKNYGSNKKNDAGSGDDSDESKSSGDDDDDDDAPKTARRGESDEKKAQRQAKAKRVQEHRMALTEVAQNRRHIRALLTMCERHNSSRRTEGLHALLNYLGRELSGVDTCRTLEELKASAPPSVPYAVSRLVLSMATENVAQAVLHTHTLCEVLQRCPAITTSVILSTLSTEVALEARMAAAESRHRAQAKKGTAEDTEAAVDADIDPDDIADPTVGERHQKTMAAILSVAAVLCSRRVLKPADASQIARILSHCYVEHKGLRVLTANLLLQLIRRNGPSVILADRATAQWISWAFFRFDRLDYLRPEGVQVLVYLLTLADEEALPDAVKLATPPRLGELLRKKTDPLEPSTLEAIGSALFRKEQVTACHPNVHPIFPQLLELVEARAAQGESLKNHVGHFVNNIIVPFRRGAVDQPRQDLFRKLVQSIGQLGLRAADETDREEAIKEVAAVGFGKRMAVGKPSTSQELRAMSVADLADRLRSLLLQYRRSLTDTGPTAVKVRTWILREVRAALQVEQREGVRTEYADDVARSLFAFAFKRGPRRDAFNENKSLYTLCDLIARSHRSRGGGTVRGRELSRCTITPLEFAEMLQTFESKEEARFNTAKKHDVFAAARKQLLDALQPDAPRSVLFYEDTTMPAVLTLLLFVVSIDDPSNEVAAGLAEESVRDLVLFYQKGTVEEVDVFFDVLMSFIMRPTAPLQVIPIMAALRPLAITLMGRFARFVRTRRPIDMITQPLVEAYHTNMREILRQEKAEAEEEDGSPSDVEEEEEDDDDEAKAVKKASSPRRKAEAILSTSDDDDSDEDSDDDSMIDSSDDEEEKEDATEADDDEEASDAETDQDAEDEADDTGDDEDEDDAEESWASEGMDDEEDSDEDEAAADQKANPAYLKQLETMLGMDAAEAAAHVYPRDQANKEKSDVVRAITLAARIATKLHTPLLVQVLQVLMAVLRDNVKSTDEVVFNATRSAIELVLRSCPRFFGYWLPAHSPSLLILLADLQSYCRKLERTLIAKQAGLKKKGTKEEEADAAMNSAAISRMRRRLATTKQLALSTFHLMGLLAVKNGAGEAARLVLLEHYLAVYCDRGWDGKNGPELIRRDLYHMKQGFAWCFVDAAVTKWERVKHVDSAQRAMSFIGACDMIRAMLPRLKGLQTDLLASVTAVIRRFLVGTPLKDIYEAKQTMLFDYFYTLKMTFEYNRRVGLDSAFVASAVKEITDNDELHITTATSRHVEVLEKMLGVPRRIRATKQCVPQALLRKQHATPWRRKQNRAHQLQEKKRTKVEQQLLRVKNSEPTEEERQVKRDTRKQLRRADRAQRAQLRQQRWDRLTSDEKSEARATATRRKQERIHKNRERKQRLHDRRAAAFQKWRQEKLQEAADTDAQQ